MRYQLYRTQMPSKPLEYEETVIWEADNEQGLIGAKVEKVIEHGSSGITLDTDRGRFTVQCSGDCCSKSWYEHLGDKTLLEGHTITGIGTVERGDLADVSSQYYDSEDMHCVEQYSVLIHSNKGTYEMEMRNNSNGYYGGQAVFSRIEA